MHVQEYNFDTILTPKACPSGALPFGSLPNLHRDLLKLLASYKTENVQCYHDRTNSWKALEHGERHFLFEYKRYRIVNMSRDDLLKFLYINNKVGLVFCAETVQFQRIILFLNKFFPETVLMHYPTVNSFCSYGDRDILKNYIYSSDPQDAGTTVMNDVGSNLERESTMMDYSNHKFDTLFNPRLLSFHSMSEIDRSIITMLAAHSPQLLQVFVQGTEWRDCNMHFTPVQFGVYRIGYNALVSTNPFLGVVNSEKKIFCELSAHDQLRITIVNKFFPLAVERFTKNFSKTSDWEKRTKNNVGGPLRSYVIYRVNLNSPCTEPVAIKPLKHKSFVVDGTTYFAFGDLDEQQQAALLLACHRDHKTIQILTGMLEFTDMKSTPKWNVGTTYRVKPEVVVKEHVANFSSMQLASPITFEIHYTSIDGVFQNDAKLVSATYR